MESQHCPQWRRGGTIAEGLHPSPRAGADVPEVIAAARSRGLHTLGWEGQFRTPGGICELYWLGQDAENRRRDELWSEYIDRSAQQLLHELNRLVSDTNLVEEGVKSFRHLAKLREDGVGLDEYLCFVLYFSSK